MVSANGIVYGQFLRMGECMEWNEAEKRLCRNGRGFAAKRKDWMCLWCLVYENEMCFLCMNAWVFIGGMGE